MESRYGRRTRQSLDDILDFARYAAALVERGKDSYDTDLMLRLAGETIVTRIGEAVSRLSPQIVADHPEIPFRLARGMRNIVSHEYDRVDPEVVWSTLQSDIPRIAADVEGLRGAGREPGSGDLPDHG